MPLLTLPQRAPPQSREFDAAAQNYAEVDFITDAEIFLDDRDEIREHTILAQFDFVERLYVQGERGRVEFGIRRAFISVDNGGPGILSKVNEFQRDAENGHCYYVSLHDAAPSAITICMNPQSGKNSLAKLTLPPARNENYLSKIAEASTDITTGHLSARLIVSLNVEGLYLAGDRRYMSSRTEVAIRAIMEIVKKRLARAHGEEVDNKGQFHRKLPVKRRPRQAD